MTADAARAHGAGDAAFEAYWQQCRPMGLAYPSDWDWFNERRKEETRRHWQAGAEAARAAVAAPADDTDADFLLNDVIAYLENHDGISRSSCLMLARDLREVAKSLRAAPCPRDHAPPEFAAWRDAVDEWEAKGRMLKSDAGIIAQGMGVAILEMVAALRAALREAGRE